MEVLGSLHDRAPAIQPLKTACIASATRNRRPPARAVHPIDPESILTCRDGRGRSSSMAARVVGRQPASVGLAFLRRRRRCVRTPSLRSSTVLGPVAA